MNQHTTSGELAQHEQLVTKCDRLANENRILIAELNRLKLSFAQMAIELASSASIAKMNSGGQ